MTVGIQEYVTANGKNPFREWLNDLDVASRARIQVRVRRFSTGNLGDHRSVGGGVLEARVMFGPGYRIYFAKAGQSVIVLLAAGNKASQFGDIRRAREFWKDYLEANRHGETQ